MKLLSFSQQLIRKQFLLQRSIPAVFMSPVVFHSRYSPLHDQKEASRIKPNPRFLDVGTLRASSDQDVHYVNRGNASSADQIFSTEEYLSIMRSNLEGYVSGESECPPESQEVLQSWIQISLSMFDHFKSNMEKFSEENVDMETDLFQRSYLDSQIVFLESLPLDLKEIIRHFKKSMHTMNVKDLQACVLALGCWPSQFTAGMTSNKSFWVLQRNHSQIREIHSVLEAMSCKRLYVFFVQSVDFFIGDIKSRLDLAKAWTHVLSENAFQSAPKSERCSGKRKPKTFTYECMGRSYPKVMIAKVCDSSGHKSQRFFSKLDSRSFVDFMKVLYRIDALPQGFHRYYVTFKTFQFAPNFGLDDFSAVCRTFLKHGLIVHSRHPLGLGIGESIVDKIDENFEDLTSEILQNLCTYLSAHFCQSPTAMKVISTQEKVAVAVKNNVKEFDLRSLISLAHVTLPREPPSSNLSEVVLDNFLKCDPQECSAQTLQKVLLLCHFGAFTGRKNDALNKVEECYKSYILNQPREQQSIEKCYVVLHLAFANRFSDEILTDLFTDPKFSEREKKTNVLIMKHAIEYGDQYRTLLIRTALKVIQGLVEIHYPTYNGPKFDGKKFMKYCSWLQVSPPGYFTTRFPGDMSEWTMVGSHIKESIAKEIHERFEIPKEEALKRYVIETSVLPFLSTVDYIFVFDSNFNIAPIPEEFKAIHLGSVKRPMIDEKTHKYWVTVSYFDSSKNCVFVRALTPVRPLHLTETLSLGYYKVKPINLSSFGVQFFLLKDTDVRRSVEDELKLFFDAIKTNISENFDLNENEDSDTNFQNDKASQE